MAILKSIFVIAGLFLSYNFFSLAIRTILFDVNDGKYIRKKSITILVLAGIMILVIYLRYKYF